MSSYSYFLPILWSDPHRFPLASFEIGDSDAPCACSSVLFQNSGTPVGTVSVSYIPEHERQRKPSSACEQNLVPRARRDMRVHLAQATDRHTSPFQPLALGVHICLPDPCSDQQGSPLCQVLPLPALGNNSSELLEYFVSYLGRKVWLKKTLL